MAGSGSEDGLQRLEFPHCLIGLEKLRYALSACNSLVPMFIAVIPLTLNPDEDGKDSTNIPHCPIVNDLANSICCPSLILAPQ